VNTARRFRSHSYFGECGCVGDPPQRADRSEKRQRTGALQDLAEPPPASPSRSVLDCGSPLPLWTTHVNNLRAMHRPSPKPPQGRERPERDQRPGAERNGERHKSTAAAGGRGEVLSLVPTPIGTAARITGNLWMRCSFRTSPPWARPNPALPRTYSSDTGSPRAARTFRVGTY